MSSRRKTGKAYPKEFRERVVRIAQSGDRRLANGFEVSSDPCAAGLSRQSWTPASARSRGSRDGIRRVRTKREDWARARVWFARETAAIPPESSSS